ncbi:MAG TPA: hypothetical protein VHU19_18430 [Pyrinomonadaceae bacterium]|jgi:hypothetical protein|nr:hypothetical protein [Pyrinomonadaceae bacterium]
MPAKSSGGTEKPHRASKKGIKSAGPRKGKRGASKKTKEPLDPSAERFVRDLLIRGEAAKPDEKGELPPGATHRIVEDVEDGLPQVERDRFSLY